MSNHNVSYEYDPVLKKIIVRNATSVPQEIFAHAAEAEILDMSFGHLTDLPGELTRFTKLKVGFFSNNDFERIPEVIASLPQLEMIGFKSCKISSIQDNDFPKDIKAIILTGNQITQLPSSIGNYRVLKKLMLAGNKLQTLPQELLNCQNLELLRLPMNELIAFPEWIQSLPRLGWYNDGANPFHTNDRTHFDTVTSVSWHDITIGDKLGQSASNEVFHGRLQNGTEVAVKLFGGELTTDGLAIDDINACLLAGTHDHIIGGISKLIDTPDGKHGLLMPLIPNTFTKLGNPPSFTTFTRDTFPAGKTFSQQFIRTVLKDVAAAMLHCHQKGIMHGDLYAHNILSDEKGHSYVGDFGAASLYEPGSADGKLRELVDVKSFGYLIDDLLNCCPEQDTQMLQTLRDNCLHKIPEERPTFQALLSMV
jgi:hypothetical protein